VARELESSGYYDTISSGVVITGGTTILDKMPELAEDMLDVPVRRGKPRGIGGLVDAVRNPKFSTGVGLVQYGAFEDEQPNYKSRRSRSLYGWFTDNVKDWIVEMF
jgi:cell division protein FtsA